MAEYIKRETAVRAVMAAKWVDGSDGAMAMKIVASPAAADVALVVHGRWIHYPDCGVTRCSHCGWSIEECWESKRCPECGAIMDGGAGHEAG